MIKKASLLCLFVSLPAFAVVPHNFKAGSPAKASEVNENFSAIEKEIISNNSAVEAELKNLNTSVSEIEKKLDSVTSESGWETHIHPIQYNQRDARVGDLVRIKDEEYRIISAPFVEFGTGYLYSLILPVNENTMSISMNYHHSYGDIPDHDFTISGYPAKSKYISDSRSAFLFRSGTSNSTLSQNYYYSTEIKVNETLLSIQLSLSETVESVQLPSGTYDFTAALDTSGLYHDHEKLEAIDKLVDYIKIIRVE